ncbi:MAG: hypothetical protein ABJR46_07050 [Tateyamaria sp.]|uniref:hypothetical protein n=1 Tax=Tateyamaria sp. TaxID=1929288 RepID=UPI00329B6269
MKHAYLLISVILAASLGSPTAALENIEGAKFVQAADFELSNDSNRQFNRFKKSDQAYSSFFASTDGTEVGLNFSMFSQSDADKHAKTICEARASAACVLYARLLPANAVGEIAVPSAFRSRFNKLKTNTKRGMFGAFAINGSGGTAISMSKDNSTAEIARNDALQLCRRSSEATRKQLPPALAIASEKNSLFDCRVVFLFQKQ